MNRVIAVLFFIVLICFSLVQKGSNNTTENGAGVIIKQNDSITVADKNVFNIKLKKIPFSLEFDVYPYDPNNKFYAVQIAATDKKSNLKYFKKGAISDDNPFLSSGTGIATSTSNQYESLSIGDGGHHYIYYKDASDCRAQFVSKNANGKVHLKWDIKKVTSNNATVNIQETSIKEIYLMVFIDDNLNKIIEPDEYNLITIQFEP